MIDSIFQGYGRLHGPISPVLDRWALPEQELAQLPGYRTDRAQRESDIAEARRMYEAAESPPLTFTFADQPSYVPGYVGPFQRNLEQTLGAKVEVEIRNYLLISEGLAKGDLPATWQYDNGWIDPDDWLYPFFHSRGTKNSFRYQDPQLDALLEAQRREFDYERRRELVRDIQFYLLEKG